jgi:hypothetical protein
MTTRRKLAVCAFCGIAAACANSGGGAQSPSTSPAQSTPAPQNPPETAEHLSLLEARDFCVRLHEEVVPCAGEFIDLNIELRTRFFPDFAREAAEPRRKAEMRRIGIDEVMQDGAGPLEPRRQRCAKYAEQGPPSPRAAVQLMEGCYARSACADKVECMRPVLEERYAKRAQSAGADAGSP